MCIKKLFAISKGEKATDKQFTKVLISSLCGILLCMGCLFSTTWAWFAQSVNNGENVIQIATMPEAVLKVDGQEFVSGEVLQGGTHQISINHNGEQDVFAQKSTLYVILSFDGNNMVCIQLNAENGYFQELTAQIPEGASCGMTWDISWLAPVNAELLTENVIEVAVENSADSATEEKQPVTEPTEGTQPVTEPLVETQPVTEPTEGTQPVTEPLVETQPVTEPTEETQPVTENTEAAEQITETTEAATETTTEPVME